jgi:ribosomal protein S18 acetylase RimI-like enzyme
MATKQPLNARIRRLTVEDASLIIDFYQSLSDQSRVFFTPHAIDPEGLKKLVRELPEHPNVHRYCAVIEEDGKEIMVGYVFFWDWDRCVPWFGIGARDQYQGRGLGNLMMRWSIEYAKEHGKGGILLTTWKANTKAQSLYKKFGYELLGVHTSGEYMMILRFDDDKEKGSC